jgi:hypothetical protein
MNIARIYGISFRLTFRLTCVGRGAMESFVDYLLAIESVDERGARQMLCDIEYLVNVVGALEMDVGERLGWAREFLEMDIAGAGDVECVGKRSEVRDLVLAMR